MNYFEIEITDLKGDENTDVIIGLTKVDDDLPAGTIPGNIKGSIGLHR